MITKFTGIALGGPVAGEIIEAHRPLYKTWPKVAVLGVQQQTTEYYYVPLLGYQGFWLCEDETKGREPFDDIIRILTEQYVASTTGQGDTANRD